MWIIYSLLAALSAAAVVVLSKAGLKDVDSNIGFAVQSVMILLVSWTVIYWQGNYEKLASINRNAWLYLLAAGIITCISSLLTFRALKIGNASQVSPLGNLSLIFSIILAVIFLRERLTWQIVLGGLLMAGGALIISLSGQSSK